MSISAVTSEKDTPPQSNDRTLQELQDAAREDSSYICLWDCVTSRFLSTHYALHSSLLPFWKFRDGLSADGDLILYGARIVVPTTLRHCTLA